MTQGAFTMEQMAQLAQMIQTRPVSAPVSRSLLGDVGVIARDIIGQTGVDGHISLGDVAKAFGVTGFFTIIGPIGTTGAGLSLNVFLPWIPVTDFAQLGLGLGMALGAWLGGKRLADDYRYVPLSDEPQIAPQPDEPDACGLRIAIATQSNRVIFRDLLPVVKRGIIRKMAQDTARLYFATGSRDGKSKNFSKRGLGKPWGEYLGETQTVLKECGHIEEVKNRTHIFTSAGRDWLADYY